MTHENKWVPLYDGLGEERKLIGEAEVQILEEGRERATGRIRSAEFMGRNVPLSVSIVAPEVKEFDPPKVTKDDLKNLGFFE